MHIYHFFNLHWEQGVWEGNVDLHPPFPPLHWSSLGFLCIPSPNQQTGCLSCASMPWAKVTFSLLCDIRFWGRGLLSWRGNGFFFFFFSCGTPHSDHELLFGTFATWKKRKRRRSLECLTLNKRQVNHLSCRRVSHDSSLHYVRHV